MQQRVRRSLLRQAYADIGKPLAPDKKRLHDFGFWAGDEAAMETFILLERHDILPYPGGWYDQPERVRDDLLTMKALYSEALRDAKNGAPLPPDPDQARRRKPPADEEI